MVVSEKLSLQSFPDPVVTKQPAAGPNVELFRVSECKIKSFFDIADSAYFWLFNGVDKIKPRRVSRNGNEATIDGLISDVRNPSDQGIYQCGVTIPGTNRVVLSEKAVVQFLDFSTTRMEVHLDEEYIAEYSNKTSTEYREMEKKIVAQMEIALTNVLERKIIVTLRQLREGSVVAVTEAIAQRVRDGEKKTICNSLDKMKTAVENMNGSNILKVVAESLDCCQPDTFGEESFKGVYTYEKTLIDQTDIQQCAYNQIVTTRRSCMPDIENGPSWLDPDLSNCPAKSLVTNTLILLNDVVICPTPNQPNCPTPNEVSQNLSSLVNSTTSITTQQDVTYIGNIVKKLAINLTQEENQLSVKNIINNVFDAIDVVIESNRTLIAKSQVSTQSSTQIVLAIESIAEIIGEALQNESQVFQVEKTNIALKVQRREPSDISVFATESNSGIVSVAFNEDDLHDTNNPTTLARGQIPKEAFRNRNQFIYSIFYRSNTLFQTSAELKRESLDMTMNNSTEQVIASNLLNVNVANLTITDLTNPVILVFQKNIDSPGISQCSFWNFSLPSDIPNVLGKWSTAGCFKDEEKSTSTEVTCKCNHLTNFAILLDVSQTGHNPLALQIITWIGCSLSLAGLILTVITYLVFRKMLKKLPPKILLSLCLSLIALLVTFLAGVEQVSPREGCQLVAALIHYFMLTTFFWMDVEGLNLYRNFVLVFKSGGESKFFLRCSLFAWGMPLIIVVIPAAIAPENLGNNNFCIVHGYSFYFAVLLPIAAIILSNFIVLGLVMRSLTKDKKNLHQDQKMDLKKNARIAFGANIILGTSWIFALLAVGDLRDVFQWLFTIFNALQGLFIFVFYTLRNKDIQNSWKDLCGIKRKEKGILSSSGGTHQRSSEATNSTLITSNYTFQKNEFIQLSAPS